MAWQFYGRGEELSALSGILRRRRFFFLQLSGRRRIGKTTLVRRAVELQGLEKLFYVSVPDSGVRGVLSSVQDARQAFGVPNQVIEPANLRQLAAFFADLIRDGYVVVLDEFQYFNRRPLRDFTSHLQAEVDLLLAEQHRVHGGLVVLGSIHAEMVALLQDRSAPLYNRATDVMQVSHLDVGAVDAMLGAHGANDPERLLFYWTLFEGVPKFYRDSYERDVLTAPRQEVLRSLFFASSAPLRTEADNWFLRELRGRYDTVLKFIARHPGCPHADVLANTTSPDADAQEAVGTYLRALEDRFQMVEARQPLGSKPNGRRRRYYLRDHFLQAWLDAIGPAVSASHFRPHDVLLAQADAKLTKLEGRSLERMTQQLWQARSRRDIADFRVTEPVAAWWFGDADLDAVAVDEASQTVRVINCKRAASKLLPSFVAYERGVTQLMRQGRFRGWRVQRVAVAPRLRDAERDAIGRAGYLAYDLPQLLDGV